MGSEREEDVGFILAAADPRVLWSPLPAPRAPPPRTRDPPCPVPSPAGGPEIRGRRPDGAYWGVKKAIGWQPRLLAVDPWCVSVHHCHRFAVLLPSSMVAYRAVCPTGDARQGDLAVSGGGSFLQGNRHAWPLMKRLADVDQRWRTLATAGPKGTHQLMLVSGVATQSVPIPAIPSMDLPSSSMRTRTLGSTAGEIRPDEREPRSVAMFGRQGATTGPRAG